MPLPSHTHRAKANCRLSSGSSSQSKTYHQHLLSPYLIHTPHFTPSGPHKQAAEPSDRMCKNRDKKRGPGYGPLQPALLRIGWDSVELRKAPTRPARPGHWQTVGDEHEACRKALPSPAATRRVAYSRVRTAIASSCGMLARDRGHGILVHSTLQQLCERRSCPMHRSVLSGGAVW